MNCFGVWFFNWTLLPTPALTCCYCSPLYVSMFGREMALFFNFIFLKTSVKFGQNLALTIDFCFLRCTHCYKTGSKFTNNLILVNGSLKWTESLTNENQCASCFSSMWFHCIFLFRCRHTISFAVLQSRKRRCWRGRAFMVNKSSEQGVGVGWLKSCVTALLSYIVTHGLLHMTKYCCM